MSTDFQTVVKSRIADNQRYDAIDRLIDRGERTNLGVIVRAGGIDGEFRRRALEGLADCNGSEELTALAEDTTIEPSLRRRADELA